MVSTDQLIIHKIKNYILNCIDLVYNSKIKNSIPYCIPNYVDIHYTTSYMLH